MYDFHPGAIRRGCAKASTSELYRQVGRLFEPHSARQHSYSQTALISAPRRARTSPAPGTGPGCRAHRAIDSAASHAHPLHHPHPDDESGAIRTYLARGLHADGPRCSPSPRGEGGQNALGPHRPRARPHPHSGPLAATSGYGVKLYFTRAQGFFGFSKLPKKPNKSGRPRPRRHGPSSSSNFVHIVINEWGVSTGHGHHQLSVSGRPNSEASRHPHFFFSSLLIRISLLTLGSGVRSSMSRLGSDAPRLSPTRR